jgi:predicted MPP superfamily phosphohydrolase
MLRANGAALAGLRMGFRLSILVALIFFNALPLYALVRSLRLLASASSRRNVLFAVLAMVLLINLPISIFWIRSLYDHLYDLPAGFLRASFIPTVAWQSSAVFFTLLFAPMYVAIAAIALVRKLSGRRRTGEVAPQPPSSLAREAGSLTGASASSRLLSRRDMLRSGPGLFVPALTVGLTGKMFLEDEVDVSKQMVIPIANLPRALDGMTLVQLSDLHAGPYIRRKEVEYWVSLANQLKPDLVVLTGDMIDRNLQSLPDLLEGLKGLKPSLGSAGNGGPKLGVVAVLGNHDLSSDPASRSPELRGGETIATALNGMGIRTLRNESLMLSANGFGENGGSAEHLAILGMDWVRRRDGSNFFAYHSAETRSLLDRLTSSLEPGTPAVLLAHHPDTFAEVIEMPVDTPIGLTLSGHTHGGGQVVFFEWGGHSYGLTSVQFQYVSGLFQKAGRSLYVNRGLGYFGVPIRINCPPEISHFKLIRAV